MALTTCADEEMVIMRSWPGEILIVTVPTSTPIGGTVGNNVLGQFRRDFRVVAASSRTGAASNPQGWVLRTDGSLQT